MAPLDEASAMVGRVGVEPTTSRLSGVRSNHLSYRPPLTVLAAKSCEMVCRGRREPAQAALPLLMPGSNRCLRSYDPSAGSVSRMKGHEDGGMFFGQEEGSVSYLSAMILRKEVIQPQVPLRLPCYDFTPVADPTVVACLPCGLA
jgi:hypothetical protein